jgi:serine/threonine-protein kinase RsbW
MDDTVTLVIPCTPEYVGVARLTILGVASRLGFSYDAVEDIRLAVAEACIGAIDRSRALPESTESRWITLRAWGDPARFTVEVEDTVPSADFTSPSSTANPTEDLDDIELGSLLIELLMDEVEITPLAQGTLVRLIKWNRT